MSPLKLSVVLPTLGKSPHLRGLLERLQRQSTDFPFEVLVVANIPRQDLRKLVNSMGLIQNARFDYLETGRLGVNLARNKGLERARGEIVLFLDDDAILESDSFLSSHVKNHDEHPTAVAIGGPYRLTQNHSIWDAAYHEVAHEWLARHTMGTPGTTQLLGGNISLKKNELERRGESFDEQIVFGGAETGLCLRLALAGCTLLYFDELYVGHAPQMTRLVFCRKAFLQGAGARWRTQVFPELEMKFTNEFRPRKNSEDPQLARAHRLYRRCFDFGWNSAPYGRSQTALPRHENPSFSFVPFLIFQIRSLTPLRNLRRFHRHFYAIIRTAWINGETSHRRSKPRETGH